MKKFAERAFSEMNRYFTPVMTAIAENRYMLAIRNGIVATIPIILVGSFFLIIVNFPLSDSLQLNGYLEEKGLHLVQTFLLVPFYLTMFILGIFVLYGIAKALCDEYKIDSLQPTMIAISIYLISIIGPTFTDTGSLTLSLGSLGAGSIFGGIFIAIFAVEVHRLCIKYNIAIRLPSQVPPAVAKAFSAVIPLLIAVVVASLLFAVLEFNIHAFLGQLLSPLQSFLAGNNLGGMIVTIFLITLLWSAGIHGVSIVGAVARPFWQIALDNNTALADGGGILLGSVDGAAIITEPFYQWFVWIGGSGATIGLIISMLIISKSRYGRSITRSSTIPSIFNINEPIVFGFPIVLNPVMLLPFILAPMVMGLVSFFVLQAGLVGLPYALPAWTLPAPIGAFFATLDWRSIILVLAMIGVSTAIWFPFAKIYDNQLVKKEIEMLSDEEKNFLSTLKGKQRYAFLWMPDESREAFVKMYTGTNGDKLKKLLANKVQLKKFITKIQKDA